jgi:hypothetical protein
VQGSGAMSYFPSSRNKMLMTRLRELFWLSAIHNFDIKAKFISGRDNVMARKKIWKKPKQILVFENSVF